MSSTALAQSLFLLAHDPFTGKPEIDAELLGCGVAAGALADLVLDRRLGVVDGRVAVIGHLPQDHDTVDGFVMDAVGRQSSPHSVRGWVTSLGEVLADPVAQVLVDDGVVRRERHRGVLRRGPDRFPAVDLLKASSPRVRLEHMLRHPGSFDLVGAVSAAIVSALGIERIFGADVERQLFEELLDHLPSELQMLVNGVADAVAGGSLIVRR